MIGGGGGGGVKWPSGVNGQFAKIRCCILNISKTSNSFSIIIFAIDYYIKILHICKKTAPNSFLSGRWEA